MTTKEHKDIGSGVFFLLFSIFLFTTSFSIKTNNSEALGPQFFPRLISYFLAALSIILIFNSGKSLLNKKKAAEVNDEQEKAEPVSKLSFIYSSLLLVFYMLSIDKLGFIITSIVYLFLQILIITPDEDKNKKNILLIGAISIVVPIALYLLFYNVFNILLPGGILN